MGKFTQLYGLGAIAIALYMQIFDSALWKGEKLRRWKYFLYGIILLLLSLMILFSAGSYPYGPICMYALGTPIWLLITKTLILKHITFKDFITYLPGPLFFLSIGVFIYWINWTFEGHDVVNVTKNSRGNEWSLHLRNTYAHEVNCLPNFEEYPHCEKYYNAKDNSWSCDLDNVCTNVYDTCLDAFLLWSLPFFVGKYNKRFISPSSH